MTVVKQLTAIARAYARHVRLMEFNLRYHNQSVSGAFVRFEFDDGSEVMFTASGTHPNVRRWQVMNKAGGEEALALRGKAETFVSQVETVPGLKFITRKFVTKTNVMKLFRAMVGEYE